MSPTPASTSESSADLGSARRLTLAACAVLALGASWGLATLWQDAGGRSFQLLAGLTSLLCLGLVIYLGKVHRQRGVTGDLHAAEIAQGKDSLTGLANRRSFAARLKRSLEDAELAEGAMVALLVDISTFSSINDAHGVDVGDEVLRAVAGRLRQVLRQGRGGRTSVDLVARMDGNTFGLLVYPGNGKFDCAVLANRVLATIAAPIEIAGAIIRLGAVMGSVILHARHESGEQILSDAEMALASAKVEGPEAHIQWSQSLSDRRRRERALASDLKAALQLNQFVLHYQPIVDLQGETVVGVEALLRWQHPVHGLLAPAAFLDQAEASGLIIPIGNWVILAALHQIAAWRERHGGNLITFVAVNVSGRQFERPELLVATVTEAHQAQLPLELLKLEITETTMIRNPDQVRVTLAELQALGASISIDDFGTGYSSLSGLGLWDFDTIKIDRSFVNGMETSRGAEILKTMLGFASVFKASVVAEGVETEAQRDFLHANGCRQAQGYLFGRPMEPSACGDFILARNYAAARLPV